MATILLFGDTVRSPALRHEVPLEIVDPFLYVARSDDAFVLTSALELGRIQAVLPRATVQLRDALGWYELIEEGMPREEVAARSSVGCECAGARLDREDRRLERVDSLQHHGRWPERGRRSDRTLHCQ